MQAVSEHFPKPLYFLTFLCYNQKPKSRKGGAIVDVQVGDRLQMKKAHPCGSHIFEVLRIGADFKIRCTGCGREVMVPRHKCEKNIRKILRESAGGER